MPVLSCYTAPRPRSPWTSGVNPAKTGACETWGVAGGDDATIVREPRLHVERVINCICHSDHGGRATPSGGGGRDTRRAISLFADPQPRRVRPTGPAVCGQAVPHVELELALSTTVITPFSNLLPLPLSYFIARVLFGAPVAGHNEAQLLQRNRATLHLTARLNGFWATVCNTVRPMLSDR